MHWWLAAALLLGGNAWGAPEIIDFEEHWDPAGVIGAPYVMRGRLVAARDLTVARPIPGAEVALTLRKGEVERRVTATTDAAGVAWLVMPTDTLTPGTWQRAITWTHRDSGGGSAGGSVEFSPAITARLTTDRPVYEPDQTLRWRLTAVHQVTGAPVAEAARVVITDPRGTRIWQGTVALDDRGMAIGTLPLGRDARRGRWTLAATVGGSDVLHHFTFKQVELAPFAVTAARVGTSDRWQIRATYPYGEPVKGTMAVKVAPLDGRPQPLVDGTGYVTLPAAADRAVTAEITVKDGAERIGRALITVPSVRARQAGTAVIAEPLAPGRPGRLTILTTTPDGVLARGTVEVQVNADPWKRLATDGAVDLTVTPSPDLTVAVRFEGTTRTFHPAVSEKNAPILTVRRNVVRRGEAIALRGRWPEAYGALVATVFRSGAPILQAPVRRTADGGLSADLWAPAVPGLVQIRVHDAGWVPSDAPERQLHAAAVDVYVRPLALDVALTPDALRLTPGAVTAFSVLVRDARGAAAAGVGLAASVVDTRLLALGPLPPPLLETIEALDVESASAAGLAFAALLRDEAPAAQRARAALLRTLPASFEAPQSSLPAAERWRAERDRLTGLEGEIVDGAAAWTGRLAAFSRADGWQFEAPLAALIPAERRQDPWARAVTWAYVRTLELDYAFAGLADRILEARANLLRDAIFDDPDLVLAARAGRSLVGRIPAHLLRDPWGHRVRFEQAADGWVLVAAGPDGGFGTADDRRVEHIFSLRGYGAGGGGMGGRMGSMPRIRAGGPTVLGGLTRHGSPTGPAIRKNFEGTVLWAIGARTDARGQARFEVPLSDRLTGWQIAVEAVGPDGAVGHAEAEIQTFLPRFAEVDLPPILARGDRYRAHAYVTNHGPDAILTLTADAEGGVTLAAPVTAQLTLARGESRRIAIPLQAIAEGDATVRLALSADGAPADRVERRLRVDPQGSLMERTYTARLGTDAQIAFEIPPDAQAPSATLRIFRSPADLALDGIEAMLRAPYGCFEQTSSTTFPNLLVLDLLRDAPGAEAVRAQALKFVALGYQRLVGYEVAGGGFSWFGEAPANKVLTAYGVLEFADMAKVYPIDADLVARTSRWLLEQQQPDGSWTPDAKWLHDWTAVQRGALATTAWIAWTLAEAGSTDPRLDAALSWLEAHQAELEPFELGLLAGAQSARGRAPSALAALHALETAGRIPAGRSLFSRSEASADVQTTALANQAFVRAGDLARAGRGLDWLWAQRTPAGWGNTQATVLALRAALGHRSRPLPAGSVATVRLDAQPLEPLALTGDAVPTRALDATPGRHVLALGAPGETRADLRVAWRSAEAPTVPVVAGLSVAVRRPEGVVEVGHAAPFAVELHNPGATAIAMPTVEVPTPPGFRVDAALFKPEGVARSEDQGDRVVFYLERLAPGERRVIEWSLQALAEVDVLHRPAVAYAYYDPDLRGQSAAARVVARAAAPVALAPAGPRLTAESAGLGLPARRSRGSADQPAGRTHTSRR